MIWLFVGVIIGWVLCSLFVCAKWGDRDGQYKSKQR